jgi:hypothetical protein
MENFWSLFKRSLKGTYVSVEPFHLQVGIPAKSNSIPEGSRTPFR